MRMRRGHLGLMRKVNDFLKSGAPDESPVRRHALKMESWLGRLQAQLGSALPSAPKTSAPNISETWGWVEGLVEEALEQIEADMERDGEISKETAWQNERALLAAMVSGLYCPPCRTSVLVSIPHPETPPRCLDPDCALREECQGNHFKLTVVDNKQSSWEYFGYNTTNVSNVIIHHKNDRCAINNSTCAIQI